MWIWLTRQYKTNIYHLKSLLFNFEKTNSEKFCEMIKFTQRSGKIYAMKEINQIDESVEL